MSLLGTLNLLYTCAKMLLKSVNLILLAVHFQPMWLAKLEPEPILQLEHHLPGHVAAQRQGDLRDLGHHLHQWDHRALEAKVSKSHGWKGAYNIAFWGIFIQSKTAIIQPKNGIFGQLLAFLTHLIPRPTKKSMQRRCLCGFSVMWVPKLLLTAKKSGFWPKSCQNMHFWSCRQMHILGQSWPFLDQKS